MNYAINSIRYPTVFAYLASLPSGLGSYPQLRSLTDLALATRERWPDLHLRDDLPLEIRDALSAPWAAGAWMPEVVLMLQTALVRDVIYRDDAAYLKFCYEATAARCSSFTARALLFFASPKMTILGCKRHWNTVKIGSELASLGGGKTDHELALTYPAGAYIGCMLEGFGQAYLAILTASGAKDPHIVVKAISRQECRFQLRWA